MLKIEYSPQALEDLQRIQNYITENWEEKFANKILKKILSDIKSLGEFPALGVDLSMLIDVPTNYRYLFTEKNYVFYYISLDKVQIVRVLNEQQDYMQQLFGFNQND